MLLFCTAALLKSKSQLVACDLILTLHVQPNPFTNLTNLNLSIMLVLSQKQLNCCPQMGDVSLQCECANRLISG